MKDVEALLKEIHDHLGSKSVYSELRGLIREFGNERATLAQLAQLAVVKRKNGCGCGVTLMICIDSQYNRSKTFQNYSE